MTGLDEYWPALEHVTTCLRTEAETVDEALLLAVHEPTMLLRRAAQTGSETPAAESELLDSLMRPATDGSAVVIAITGASGVGKSHMVRWLRAQLERHPRRQELVIVSIPKTASLRRVVELILEPLNSPEYETLKHQLASATQALSQNTATELLAAALGEELREYAERMALQVRAATAGGQQSEAPKIGVAQHARQLVLTSEVRDSWFRDVLARIVNASLGGSSDPFNRQFCEQDLLPPEDLGGLDIPRGAQAALNFLASANGRYRGLAVDILQEVLDGALRTVFQLNQALQQKPVQDFVEDIRRQLLEDGKELVLLIEDLAALSGIQQPLLDIMIAESDEHGKRVRAPIRTAVAVTDGFLAGRQTVLTRAREQWVVPSEGLSEAHIVEKLIDMSGRYLNAARWGLEHLRRKFLQAEQNGSNFYAWVPKFEPTLPAQASDLLDAFGHSTQGYALFPFNRAAIRMLAASAMQAGGVWRYNPRAFINEVLRHTLADGGLFLEHRFPPPGFRPSQLIAEVRTELQARGIASEERQRLEVALYFWGENPNTLSTAPPELRQVFDAFNLPWPFHLVGTQSSAQSVRSKPASTLAPIDSTPDIELDRRSIETSTPKSSVPSAPDISPFATALENWGPTARLVGDLPKRIRVLISRAMNERLEMGNLCMEGLKVDPAWFWLPPVNSIGNPNGPLVIPLAENNQPIPPRVIAGLKALARWEQNRYSWNFTSGETDYAAANALLEPLEELVLNLLIRQVELENGIVLQALHTQNLLLGLSRSAHPEKPNLKDLLAARPVEPMIVNESLPKKVDRALAVRDKALGGRIELQERLKHWISCFQGNGYKVLAINMERLNTAWSGELPPAWVPFLNGRTSLNEDAKDVLERVCPNGMSAFVEDLKSAIELILPLTGEAFDESHARVSWRDEMRNLIKEAYQLSIWPDGIRQQTISDTIDRLSQEDIESAIRRLRKMVITIDEGDNLDRLMGLSLLPLPRLTQIYSDVVSLNDLFSGLDRLIKAQTRSLESTQALDQRDALIKSLVWEE